MRKEVQVVETLKKDKLFIPGRIFRGKLAEPYDGIGQYALVNLSGGSTSSALRVLVAAGDFGGGRTFPTGTPVTVTSKHGRLEVFLGNKGKNEPCDKFYVCCPDIPIDSGCQAFRGASLYTPNGYQPFAEVQGNTVDKATDGRCEFPEWEPAAIGNESTGPAIVDLELTFYLTREVIAIFPSEQVTGMAQHVIDGDDTTYWRIFVLGDWVGVDLGTPRTITQFRTLMGSVLYSVSPPSGEDAYFADFLLEYSVDGGVSYSQAYHVTGAGPEVNQAIPTITARHWRVRGDIYGVGPVFRVYDFQLKDSSGKNWALKANSPATVYDPRKANWIYVYMEGDPSTDIDVWVDGTQVETSLDPDSSAFLADVDQRGVGCGTPTFLTLYKYHLSNTYTGKVWYIRWNNVYFPGHPRNYQFDLLQIMAFNIPE